MRGRAIPVTVAGIVAFAMGCAATDEPQAEDGAAVEAEDEPGSEVESETAQDEPGSEVEPDTAQDEQQGGAVTIDNCGRELVFEVPPERIVGTTQMATEMLVALDQTDRVVGTGFRVADPLPGQVDDFERIPELAEGRLDRELVLGAEPDLLVTGFFTIETNPDDGIDSLEALESAGMQVFGLANGCADDPASVTIEDLYQDLRDLGEILGAPDEAARLVAEMQDTIDDVQQRLADVEPLRGVTYSAGDDPLGLVAAGIANEVMRLAGVENPFGDLDVTFAQVPAEEVIAADPEVYLLLDFEGGPTPQDKAETLFELMPGVAATEEQRTVVVEDAGMNQSIRNADTIARIAEELFPEAF